MRSWLTAITAIAFAFAALQAPFAHTHSNANHDDHGGPLHAHAVHFHDADDGENHHDDDTSIAGTGAGDDAQAIDSFTAVKTSKQSPYSLAKLSTAPCASTQETEALFVVTPRAHDPPSLLAAPPRAPPA
jgi:hypothetical protein